MANILLLCIAFAFFHLIYDGILAPAFRESMRYDLFAARDRVIRAYIDRGISEEAFLHLQDELNAAINIMPDAGITTMFHAKRLLAENPSLAQHIDEQIEMIRQCDHESSLNARKLIVSRFYISFGMNLGAWWLLLVPIAVFCAIRQKLVRLFQRAISMPDEMIRQLCQPNNLDRASPLC